MQPGRSHVLNSLETAPVDGLSASNPKLPLILAGRARDQVIPLDALEGEGPVFDILVEAVGRVDDQRGAGLALDKRDLLPGHFEKILWLRQAGRIRTEEVADDFVEHFVGGEGAPEQRRGGVEIFGE